MKYKVGDKVFIEVEISESYGDVDGICGNLYDIKNIDRMFSEDELIPSPIAKIEERIKELEWLQREQDQIDKTDITFSYAQAEVESILKLLKGE